MKRNILIIGAGQIGTRHLQALALLSEPCNLFVVDPIESSRAAAVQKFEAVIGYNKHYISCHNSIRELPVNSFFIAIIATSSDVRANVIQSLLHSNKVVYIILEKVLFQALNDYRLIEDLFQKFHTQAYVNCPRRMYDFYRDVKTSLPQGTPVQMEVVGNNWGLACNSIHFIDLFNFLTGKQIFRWQNNLDNEIIKSKRSGYIEMIGNIVGHSAVGNSISITCYKEGHPNISVRISTPGLRLTISEGLGKAYREEISSDWRAEEVMFNVPFQSQLTNIVTEQLIETGRCGLTPYNTSASLHIPFMKLMLAHYNSISNTITDICPIT